MPKLIYTLLMYVVALLMPLKLLWRGVKQPEYLAHWGERYGFYAAAPNKKLLIWIHCVSVGETRAAQPLMLTLLRRYPHHHLLITHGTPTGRATSEQLFKGNIFQSRVTRAYLPVDIPFCVNRFLAHFQPVLGILMETELWFNLIDASHARKTPIVLLNGRMSEKSAQGYRKLGRLVSDGLQQLNWVAAQTLEDEKRFLMLGAHETLVCGNLKFDVEAPAHSLARGLELRKHIGEGRTVFMAASTREGEEPLILDAVKELPVLTLLVPRHPQRFDEVEVLLMERHIPYILRSDIQGEVPAHVQVVLGNTMGEMYTYYAACDFAFIGGSLLKFGGQNLIEAASMGKPLLFGPHMFNFAEASKLALLNGAANQVKDIAELRQKVMLLSSDENKRAQMSKSAIEFSKASTGATVKLLTAIEGLLPK